MKFLILDSKNPYRNLAIEEYLFNNADDDIFMLWQNEPTVVIGKNQNAFAEINHDFLKRKNIHIARRITGGGAVYHDLGNVNYTYISKHKSETGIDFDYFTRPIVDFLKKHNIPAKLSGRNDILVEDKKISGNAQHNSGDVVLHHGTILFDSELSVLSDVLSVDEEKIKAKAIKSTRSRVTNLKPYFSFELSTDDFIKLLSEYVIENYSPEVLNQPENQEINALYQRNASNEWLYPEKAFVSEYKIRKKKKYDFGIVDLYLDMVNDKISKIKIYGDFFGNADVSEIEALLNGTHLTYLSEKLEKINISKYIFGMTNEEFIDLLVK